MYLHKKNKYNILTVLILYCKTLLLPLRWDTGKVRGRFGGMGRFKGGLRCKGWVNNVIRIVITEINYRCTYTRAAQLIEFLIAITIMDARIT